MDMSFEIVPERYGDGAAREALLDSVMGPGRIRKTSQRLREGREPAPGLSFSASAGGMLIGTVRLWQIRSCGLGNALLLGPLAIDGRWQGEGVGKALMRRAIADAAELGYGAIVLVGDAPYYQRFGFTAHAARRLAMPGPFERDRLLALPLHGGALDRAHGVVRPCGSLIGVREHAETAIAA